jgi:hypothetical protein
MTVRNQEELKQSSFIPVMSEHFYVILTVLELQQLLEHLAGTS